MSFYFICLFVYFTGKVDIKSIAAMGQNEPEGYGVKNDQPENPKTSFSSF